MNNNKAVAFLLLSLLILLKNHASLGAVLHDTLSVGESLSGDKTIYSAKGIFEIGFFKPGKSTNYYLGMWYRGLKQTVPWVANREKPFSDKSSTELRFSNGNLVLYDGSKTPIWSTNAPPSNSSTRRAVILDNGNLILHDGNASEYLWESFDYPTNTWLPGAKLGINKRTGQKYSMTSWKSSDDPAPGLYSFVPVSGGDNVLMWNGTVRYWKTGGWDPADKAFTDVPEIKANKFYYEFSLISNGKESYYTFKVLWDEFNRFVIDVRGEMKQIILDNKSKDWNVYWTQPRRRCDVQAFCGPFSSCDETTPYPCKCLKGFHPDSGPDLNSENYLAGCRRNVPLGCSNSSVEAKPDKFQRLPYVTLPMGAMTVGWARNKSACQVACLGNCTCTAFSFGAGQCSVWARELINLDQLAEGDERGRVLFLRLAASEVKGKKKPTVAIAGAVAGVAVASAGMIAAAVLICGRRRVRRRSRVEGTLVAFGYRDLQTATKNFSEKLGGGGFGSVFKGTLPDSSQVAVKKLESVSQGEKEFRAEVATIGAIQHVNLVRLRGFCTEGTHKLLVYEYMPNGSLSSHLFPEKSPHKVLDWKTRYQITLGTARGLQYLHEKCRDCIIHCDIKPENILLDQNLLPKVADFGLAKLVGRDFSRVLTDMRGTIGYLAPEWIAGVAVTPKADVYSFGMMLFEIVSGQRNAENNEPGSRMKYFPSVATNVVVHGEGEMVSLLDPRLGGIAEVEELERVCRVACWCIQDEESHRPSMGQVVQILEGLTDVNIPPVPRNLRYYETS